MEHRTGKHEYTLTGGTKYINSVSSSMLIR